MCVCVCVFVCRYSTSTSVCVTRAFLFFFALFSMIVNLYANRFHPEHIRNLFLLYQISRSFHTHTHTPLCSSLSVRIESTNDFRHGRQADRQHFIHFTKSEREKDCVCGNGMNWQNALYVLPGTGAMLPHDKPDESKSHTHNRRRDDVGKNVAAPLKTFYIDSVCVCVRRNLCERCLLYGHELSEVAEWFFVYEKVRLVNENDREISKMMEPPTERKRYAKVKWIVEKADAIHRHEK